MNSQNTDKTFWKIVDDNQFNRDVLAPAIAAEDKIVRATISFSSGNNMPSDKAAQQNIYMDLERHIVRRYNLPAELSDLVFSLCEDMLKRGDFEREQA